jgi:hypothetical protein
MSAAAFGTDLWLYLAGVSIFCLADVLSFEVFRAPPSAEDGVVFVSIDDFLKYTPFFADFGPPNLGKVSPRELPTSRKTFHPPRRSFAFARVLTGH